MIGQIDTGYILTETRQTKVNETPDIGETSCWYTKKKGFQRGHRLTTGRRFCQTKPFFLKKKMILNLAKPG